MMGNRRRIWSFVLVMLITGFAIISLRREAMRESRVEKPSTAITQEIHEIIAETPELPPTGSQPPVTTNDYIDEASPTDAATWQTHIQILGWGRPGTITVLTPVTPDAPHGMPDRVEFQYDGLTEWYEARETGRARGVTVAQAPATSRDQPLVLELAYTEGLDARMALDGLTITWFGANNEQVLQYADPQARDASERPLPTELILLDDHRFQIQIDDTSATYPVTIQ